MVGFQAGLSPTSFHLSQFFSFVSLGACGRVPGWLVSRHFSFVSQFFSFVSQAGCLWSGSWLACLPLPFMCPPLFSFVFICLPGLRSGSRLACLQLAFICLPVLSICLAGWVLVVGFLASLSPTCFHLSPTSFHLSPRLGACGRVPGWLVSHFLSCVSQFFSFVSQFFSFVSQAGCLWAACLPLPFMCLPVLFICLPGWALVVGLAAGLLPGPTCFHVSPTSFHLSPRLFLVVGFRARLSPSCFHVSPNSFHLSPSLQLPFICLPLLFILQKVYC